MGSRQEEASGEWLDVALTETVTEDSTTQEAATQDAQPTEDGADEPQSTE